MGTTFSWHCKDCGAGESFMCGGGMMWHNEPEFVQGAHDGNFGPAMRLLLGAGIPDGWEVFRENEFYRCPGCDTIIPGSIITIDDRSEGHLVYRTKPGECPVCGEISSWDEKNPVTEDELLERCMSYVRGGCPECGGSEVSLEVIEWD